MSTLLILWTLCAGLSYFIARDRAPSKTPLATLLGFLLGPIGVAVTFFLKDGGEAEINLPSAPEGLGRDTGLTEQNSDTPLAIGANKTKSMEDLKRDLEALRSKLDTKR